MSDKTEQPGPSEAKHKVSVIESDEDDVEGSRRVGTHLTDDEPGPSEAKHKVSVIESDEDDVEGHKVRTL